MYRSRFVALQDMIKRQYRKEEVVEMRQLLMQEEQWQADLLLPLDWLYKVKWSGMDENRKWSENITYLSSDGQVFDSNKSACDFVRDTPGYTELELANCSQFQRGRSEKRKRETVERSSENEKKGRLEAETRKRKSENGDENPKRRKN